MKTTINVWLIMFLLILLPIACNDGGSNTKNVIDNNEQIYATHDDITDEPELTQSTQTDVPTISDIDDEITNYITIGWDDLLQVVYPLIDEIVIYTGNEISDEKAMSLLRDKLIAMNIETGLVKIQSPLGAEGNLDTCVAVKTIDRGTVFLYIVQADIEFNTSEDRLQFVYLEKGEKVGILPARFSKSNEYSWYKEYLTDIYEYYDNWEYLAAYGEIVDENYEKLLAIDNKNTMIIHFIEDPPVVESAWYVDNPDEVNAEFDMLIDLANKRIDTYNDVYLAEYNAQATDFNNELEIAEEMSANYPDDLICIEEYYTYPWEPIMIPEFELPDYILPIKPASLAQEYTDIDTYLAKLAEMINEDDSYNPVGKPDKDSFRTERITDKNYVVVDYEIK